MTEQSAANDDDIEYVTGECGFSFEELLEVMRDGGAEVTRCLITEDGPAILIAND